MNNKKKDVDRETKEVADTKAKFGTESAEYKAAVEKLNADK